MTTRIVPPDPNEPPQGGDPTRQVPAGDLPPASRPTQQVPIQPGPPTVPLDPTVAGTPPPPPWTTPVAGVPLPPPTPTVAYPTVPPVVEQVVTTTTVQRSTGPLPWILGGLAALVLAGLLGLFLTRNNGAAVVATVTSTPTATVSETPTVGPSATALVVVVTVTAGPATDTATAAPATATTTPAVATATTTATATATAALTATPIPGLPTVTARPTDTAVPPTATPLPAPTQVPPTATAVPPKPTQVPFTPTVMLPTPTPTLPTDPPSGGGSPVPAATLQPLDTMTPAALPTATGTPPAPAGGPPADVAPVQSAEGYLTVQWLGQSAFLLAAGEDTRLLIDPVGPDFGYHLPFFDKLDAVLISHLHPDHTYTKVVPGSVPTYVGLDSTGHFQSIRRQIKAVAVRNVAASHDDTDNSRNGANAVWVIDIDGFHVVHLGDLGQTTLTQKQLGEIGKPDILMIPVGGGGFTIDGGQARRIIGQLKPALVLPMHYQTDRTPADLPLQPVNDFLGGPPPTGAPNSVHLKRSDLPTGAPRVLVLNYK